MKKLFFSLFVCISFTTAQTLIETVPLPSNSFYNSGYGLVYVNGKYWISSGSSSGNGLINAVNSSGVQIDQLSINYPTMKASQGLAYDGTDFLVYRKKDSEM